MGVCTLGGAANPIAPRAAWEQMLKIRPGHPGVQEAIDKLPKAPGG